ncbi:MAG: energy-coupling factor ABC transporter ATP-binding protein [Oscillospiraceae bacterium]|nr:energy-coupling factor ABC transporter ATP-binding protein [Oscillospiraceae bacterium]
MPLFTLENVDFKNIITYPRIEIQQNALTFICGESGSGKSTLLKLLNGVISPSDGIITYSGKNLDEYTPVMLRREVLLCGQSAFLFEGSIWDNFNKYRDYRELPPLSPEEARKYLKICAADFSLESPCDTMSGGERQRVFIAICLSFCPKVLLLDEPTSALDDTTANTLMSNVKEFCKRENITLIVISHSKTLAATYADYIITLSHHGSERHGHKFE